MISREDALTYHASPSPGKIAVIPTKPCETSRDLSLAYSPGVAEPCLEIARNEELVYQYTSKGNLVAVISNGTAVLGLGNIGPSAAKPVMEGKGILFKMFADINVFDIELNCKSPQQFIDTVTALAPTFGGINLEDIKAPECFFIEEELKKRLDIPVFHDDQHGTAIIAGAAFLNALEIAGKKMDDVRLVVSGAGASAIACAKLVLRLGFPKENLIMCDSQGVIYQGRRDGMNEFKAEFVAKTSSRTLADALVGADAFFGLSKKDVLTPTMLRTMAENPIVFAMANPDPEIDFHLAKSVRNDLIMATGRSDCPNQANNVLGFPFIFRGALDVRAKTINEEMKLAAVMALAALAKEPVPENVRAAYANIDLSFGRDYFIPKPFDPRVLYYVAPAVAKAAMTSGVARKAVDLEDYTLLLKGKQNQGRVILRSSYNLARRNSKKRVAFPEGSNPKVMKAALMAFEESVAEPVLIGKASEIIAQASRNNLDITWLEIVEPKQSPHFEHYVSRYYEFLCRKGKTLQDARREVEREEIFANLMLAERDVEAVICGVDRHYPELVKPILDIVGLRKGVTTAAGLYLLSIKDELYFFADTTINIEMTSEKLASIALMTAEFAESMNITPRIAMLSFSNFGSIRHPLASIVRDAAELVHERAPHLHVDGELQADTAVVSQILQENYPFSRLSSTANVLIFPDMQSGNISYKLLQRLGGALVVGPIILGLKAPAYVMQRHASVDEIFNMITVAVAQAVVPG